MAKLQLQDVKIFELAEKTLASKLDEARCGWWITSLHLNTLYNLRAG